MDELAALATRQALATWKKVEVSNGSHVVTVRPISKTRVPGCALFHHVIRKHGNILRDHTLKNYEENVR
jgi:hypothetical protein